MRQQTGLTERQRTNALERQLSWRKRRTESHPHRLLLRCRRHACLTKTSAGKRLDGGRRDGGWNRSGKRLSNCAGRAYWNRTRWQKGVQTVKPIKAVWHARHENALKSRGKLNGSREAPGPLRGCLHSGHVRRVGCVRVHLISFSLARLSRLRFDLGISLRQRHPAGQGRFPDQIEGD